MITDSETNFLYLADTLQAKYPNFYARLEKELATLKINYGLLKATKDVWAVDYMPIQISQDKFVQFTYNPDYLKRKKWRKTISDASEICNPLAINPVRSSIVLDGGNVVKSANTIIMCDKVFYENPHHASNQLIGLLENIFEVDQVIFIPTDPTDIIGHADGVARFINDTTVLINQYSNKDKEYGLRLKLALHNAGLDYIELPYNPYSNKDDLAANGIYINYLQMQQALFVPTFGIKEDELAIRQLEILFTGQNVVALESNDIANDGGILNCISWNILTDFALEANYT